jgi:hypothetical protein
MAANDGEHPVTSVFGAMVPAGTGAPGTPGVHDSPAGAGGGAVIASPVVSNPYGSSQVAVNMPSVLVTQGDTAGMASDSPVPPPGDPLTGLGLDSIASTGAGLGSAGQHRHPNAGGGR